MRRNEIDLDCSHLAFDFFYWFSRFEFALKENKYLKSKKEGDRAEPGWREFTEVWQTKYISSTEARALLMAAPKQQVVSATGELCWTPVRLDDSKWELAKVIRLLKTVRNNLFHGGKHGVTDWDEPERMMLLVRLAKTVLDQLSQLGDLEADYRRYY